MQGTKTQEVYQRNPWGVGQMQFLSIWTNCLIYPAREFIYAPSPTRTQLLEKFCVTVFEYVVILCPADENIDIWGPHFESGTSISLAWSSFPNILTPTVLRLTDFALKRILIRETLSAQKENCFGQFYFLSNASLKRNTKYIYTSYFMVSRGIPWNIP